MKNNTPNDHYYQFVTNAQIPTSNNTNHNKNNTTLLNHIHNLLQVLSDHRNNSTYGPVKTIDKFEILSKHLKNSQFSYKQPLKDYQVRQIKPIIGPHTSYRQKMEQLNSKSSNVQLKNVIVPNFLAQFQALKTAGISIGQKNHRDIIKVIKIIAKNYRAKQLRFWGKILGMKDYYVIQGISGQNIISEFSKDSQNPGTGINTYSYWVSTNILGQWTQLPQITPTQLRGAKQIKHIFTGELETILNKFPVFDGKQKHLLKAQIVRITHSCELVPRGLYKVNQQNPTIIDLQQQFKFPQISQQIAPQSWIHANPYILNQGRCSYYIDPTLSQQQKQALNTQNTQKDPLVQRLKSIAQDKAPQKLGFTTNWIIQQMGQTQNITLTGKQEGQITSYGVVLLRNLTWPGATTIGFSGGWANIYVGYGHKSIQNSFNPIQPNELSGQGQDRIQYREPNPSKIIVETVAKEANEQNQG